MPEMSLLGFIEHLAHFSHRAVETEHAALEHIGRIVQTEARSELGTYQAAAEPFAGWAELADSTKEDRVHQGYTENDPGLRSGEMRDGIAHEVGDKEVVIGSNDDKMVWFELGTSKQPPRSTLGIAVIHKEDDIAAVAGGSVVTALIGRDVFNGKIPISGG